MNPQRTLAGGSRSAFGGLFVRLCKGAGRPRPASRRILSALSIAAFGLVGCGPAASVQRVGSTEVVVGSTPDPGSRLLADLYVGALRGSGFAARPAAVADPWPELDSGAVTVVPGWTGELLSRFDPRATALSAAEVYRAMVAALPEGIMAGDYSTAAQDSQAPAVARETAAAWGGTALRELVGRCREIRSGALAGSRPPVSVGGCRLARPQEFASAPELFDAVRAGTLTVAWTTTAAIDVPPDVVLLADATPALIRAQNLVPLYRRNGLSERQLLAVNEIAGVLDTAGLVDMRTKVAAGADPDTVAAAWLGDHPLGR